MMEHGRIYDGLPTVAIDTREQCPLELKHLPTERAGLNTGDYGLLAVPRLVAIERKSTQDLIGSLTAERDRFMRELDRMRAYPLRRLLIVGTRFELQAQIGRRKTSLAAILGSVRAIDAGMGIPVVWADTPARAAELVELWSWYAWRDYVKPFKRLDTPAFIHEIPL